MPYAGFFDDVVVLTKPSLDDVKQLAASKPSGVLIFDYPFESLQPLAVLAGLEILKIQDSGVLRSLEGTAALGSLKKFNLSTPPTWDGTGKRVEVESFAPLTKLTSLERLLLLSVRPQDADLTPIMTMTHLKEVDIDGVPEFTIEHYARLAAALPQAEGRCLKPYCVIAGVGICKKCKAQQVLLTGTPPRARKWMCPVCNKKKIDEHVRAWEEVLGVL